MKILISTAGSHGDVLPFIALARELKARGHDPVLYANPFFERYAADASIPFVPISTIEAYRKLFGEATDSNPRKAFKRVAQELAELCPAYYQAMKADVVAGETIAVGGSLLFAPRLLRETDGVPCATVHLAPSVFRSNLSPARLLPKWIDSRTPALMKRLAWWILDKFSDRDFTAPLNSLRADLGLPRVERIFRSWIHEADCVVGMFPDWFAEPQGDWPEHAVLAGFPLYDHGEQVPLPQRLNEFIEAGPPPVAFSAGTATATAHGFFKASVEACQEAELRGILISHVPEQIPASLPKGVIHVNYAPFSALLPRLAAFVHHGGIGSTSQALRAGVPQLIRPVAYDQFDNASRAVRLGVASEILPNRYTARAVAATLRQIVADDSLRLRCRQVSTQFANCSPIASAADTILGTLGRSTPGVPVRRAAGA